MIAPRRSLDSIRQEHKDISALKVDNIADRVLLKQLQRPSLFSKSLGSIGDTESSSSNNNNNTPLKVVVPNNNNHHNNDADETASTARTSSSSSTSSDATTTADISTNSSSTGTTSNTSVPKLSYNNNNNNDNAENDDDDDALVAAKSSRSTSLRARSAKLLSSLRSGSFKSITKNKNKNKLAAGSSEEEALIITAQTFVDAAAPMMTRIREHPFLETLADGTLDEESFRDYILQDALFLHEVAGCLRLLSIKAPTGEASSKLQLFASNIENCVHEIHGLFLLKWVTKTPADFVEDPTAGMPNTLLATSYLRRVATSEKYELGLAALLPCVWIHMGVVVQTLSNLNNKKKNNNTQQPKQKQQQNPLGDAWIELYGKRFRTREGTAFLDSWCRFGIKMDTIGYAGMVDAECLRLQHHPSNSNCSDLQKKLRDTDKSTLKRMRQHFAMGCRFEHMLLDQARTRLQWPGMDDDDL